MVVNDLKVFDNEVFFITIEIVVNNKKLITIWVDVRDCNIILLTLLILNYFC